MLPANGFPGVWVRQSHQTGEVTERANSGLACLSLLLGFHQIPSDVGQLHHAAGASGEIDSATLVRLARKLGARASQRRIAIDKLPSAPLPCIARGRDGEFFILASIRDGQALIQPADGPPQTLSAGELADLWDGEAVLITTRAASGGAAAFDVTWFIPALVKYRGLIGEVLAASFVLQLFALAAPLVFQVVIDKVLVHQVLSCTEK